MDLKDKKTSITYYAGMKSIGGTYIEVKYENYRIIFDCGSIFDPMQDDEISFDKIIEKGFVPQIDGLFDGQVAESDQTKTAVLVSHIHLDHTKMINYIDKSIDVYMSEDTRKLLYALNIKSDFIYSNPNLPLPTRDIIGVDYGQEIEFGKIKVKFVRVDHDGYGACAYIITTPDYKIAYSGDIRLHGYLKEESENFIKLAKNTDLLIIEGVSVSFMNLNDPIADEKLSEDAMLNKFFLLEDEYKGKQISFNYYIANIERISNIIKKSSRKVVLNQFYAYVYYRVTGQMVHYYKNDENDFMLDKKYEIKLDQLIENSDKYLLQVDQKDDLVFNRLNSGGLYIHCDASPLGDFDPLYMPFMQKFIDKEILVQVLKCSGHAHPRDLYHIIDEISPKILTPIHSFKPEMLYNKNGETILPKKNQTI